MKTWTSWPRPARCRPMPPRSPRSVRRRPAGRSSWRDHREPASRRPSPTCWPGPSPTGGGCCSSAEKRAALDVVTRRLDAIGLGSVLPGSARQVQQAVGGPRRRSGRRWTTRLRSTARDWPRWVRTCGRPAASSPGMRQRCTNRTAPGCRSTRRARPCCRSATSPPRLPIPVAAAGCFANRRRLAGFRRALTTVGDVAASAAPTAGSSLGVRRLRRCRCRRRPGRGHRIRRRRPRAAPSGVLADTLRGGARTGRSRRAAGARSIGRVSPSRCWTKPVPPVGIRHHRGDHRAALRIRGDDASGAGIGDPGRDRTCRWPTCTAQAQAAAASSWFGRKKRLLAVRDQLGGVLRPGARSSRPGFPTWWPRCCRCRAPCAGWPARRIDPRRRRPGRLEPADRCGPATGRRARSRGCVGRVPPSIRRSHAERFAPGPRRWVSAAATGVRPGPAAVVLNARSALTALVDGLRRCRPTCCPSGPATSGFSTAGGTLPPLGTSVMPRWHPCDDGWPCSRRWNRCDQRAPTRRVVCCCRARSLPMTRFAPSMQASQPPPGRAPGSDRACQFRHRDAGRQIRRFTGPTIGIREQLRTAIPRQVLDRRSFDAASGLGQVGELQRELARQRRGLPVRGLLSKYGELITAIMPCMLVSPDSLARFFPPRPGLSTWWCSTRRRRSGSPTRSARWDAADRWSSSATASRCPRPRSPNSASAGSR